MAIELVGTSEDGIAVSGESQRGEGVRGVSLEGLEGAGVVGKGSPQGSLAGRFDGDVNVDGTVKVLDVIAQGNISAIGNVNAGDTVNTTHVSAQGNISAVGNVNAGNVNAGDTVNTTLVVAQGNISSLGNVNAGDTVNTTHVVAQGNISAVGNVNAGNVNAGDTVNTTLVVAQGNISSLGNVNAGDTVNTTHVVAQGNISAVGNVNAGNMNVTGDITLAGGDCAEEFEVDATCAQHVAPGTVVVFGDEGRLRHSTSSYDKRVAGVVSGGGHYKPGIIFDRRTPRSDRMAVALLGKVFCNVDATYESIEVGDLLTTSDTPGHAMKASDSSRAFGAVIGKALRPFRDGQGLIPILIALQ